MKSKRKAIFVPEELHALIKQTADKNNRKIVDELRERFGDKLGLQTPHHTR